MSNERTTYKAVLRLPVDVTISGDTTDTTVEELLTVAISQIRRSLQPCLMGARHVSVDGVAVSFGDYLHELAAQPGFTDIEQVES